jgi:hypothetical protein
MKINSHPIVKFIVQLRMAVADLRGHHGKRWDYEPSNYYLGMKKSKRYRDKLLKHR